MNVDTLRDSIPTFETARYCNWGASGPSPRPVVDAFESTGRHHEFEAHADEGAYPFAWEHYETVRESAAEFVGASADELALTESTTDGINRVLGALEWDSGDVVVTTDVEHPAVELPLKRLQRHHGVELRIIETDTGLIDPDAALPALGDAKLFVFSAVDWLHGAVQPVAELVERAHDAGALVLVDAVQAVGQRPVAVSKWGADFVAAAGHKWLMGTWGSGFLYVDDDVARSLQPGTIGYRSVVDSAAEEYQLEPGAKRFEVGTTNLAPHGALQAAIELVEDVGMETIQVEIRALTEQLKEGLSDDRLLSPREFHSGLVTVACDEPERTVSDLADRGIIVRSLPADRRVRVSLHAVNTPEDVWAVLDGI